MSLLSRLPFTEGAKTIVVEEGLDAAYGKCLIAGWIRSYAKNSQTVEILAFGNTKRSYLNDPEPFSLPNVTIHDYYSQGFDEIINTSDVDEILHSSILNEKSVIIVDCLSSLALRFGVAKASRFVEKLIRRTNQTICLCKRDFPDKRIPCVETLGTTLVKIEPSCNSLYNVRITHQKVGGSVLHQTESVKQNDSYEIQSEKLCDEEAAPDVVKNVEMQASFRLEVNEREKEQRRNTQLPYTATIRSNESKIIYEPDKDDDLDEEDPDDDLYI